MSELVGWLILAGLAAAIACIFLLSSQLEEHMRSTAELMMRNNEMILARLDRLVQGPAENTEPSVGVILERRNVRRDDPLTHLTTRLGAIAAADLPRRRYDDAHSA